MMTAGGMRAQQHGHGQQSAGVKTHDNWSELIASMETMHAAKGEIEPSDNSDVNFVRLMLPIIRPPLIWPKTHCGVPLNL
jgi:hypothetical protein